MGREIRMVPPDWQHPKKNNGRFVPLLDGDYYESARDEFMEMAASQGIQRALDEFGKAPDANDYMLAGVPKSKRTWFMMYEDTSEGTPVSPAFPTAEECARWCADNEVSAFGGITADYDWWLAVAQDRVFTGVELEVGHSVELLQPRNEGTSQEQP